MEAEWWRQALMPGVRERGEPPCCDRAIARSGSAGSRPAATGRSPAQGAREPGVDLFIDGKNSWAKQIPEKEYDGYKRFAYREFSDVYIGNFTSIWMDEWINCLMTVNSAMRYPGTLQLHIPYQSLWHYEGLVEKITSVLHGVGFSTVYRVGDLREIALSREGGSSHILADK